MSRRVLVARLDSMGDVLLMGPAIRAIARRAHVTMLCGPRGAQAAELLPGVDHRIVWDAPWIADPPPAVEHRSVAALIDAVRAARVDEAVIFTSFHQSSLPLALVLRLAGVGRIVAASTDYPGSLLDVRLRPGEELSEDIPETERALAIAGAAGYPCGDDGALRVRPVPSAVHLAGASGYVVLHPGADASARRWPLDSFAGAASMLVEQGIRVIVTGGADERSLGAFIVEQAPGSIDLSGRCSLPELAGVLAGAAVIVSGNTGPAHLAAAMGTPVVCLFSPVVSLIRWGPYGVPVRILGDQDAPCRNTRARECPVPGHPCLSGVDPEDVVAAALELMGHPPVAVASPAPRTIRKGAGA